MNDRTNEAVGIPTGRQIRNPGYNRLTGRGKHSKDVGIKIMRSKRGAIALVAKALNLTDSSVGLWRTVPLEYVFRVAVVIGVRPEELHPEFFKDDPLRVVKRCTRLGALLNADHDLIWRDAAACSNNAHAAATISGLVGEPISVTDLIRRFGPSRRPKARRIAVR